MTNDEKITTIAKLLHEMADEFGGDFGVSLYSKGPLYSNDYYAVSINRAVASDKDPAKALTQALAEIERTAARDAIEAEVRAEVAARLADRKAA